MWLIGVAKRKCKICSACEPYNANTSKCFAIFDCLVVLVLRRCRDAGDFCANRQLQTKLIALPLAHACRIILIHVHNNDTKCSVGVLCLVI